MPGATPRYGTIELLGESHAAFLELDIRLTRFITNFSIKTVVYEQPLKKGSFDKLRLTFGFCAIIECVAARNGCVVREAPIEKWREHFLGYGGYSTDDAKRAAMTRCKQLGLKPDTHDCAEAIGIHDWACSLRSTAHSVSTTPLFAGVENG